MVASVCTAELLAPCSYALPAGAQVAAGNVAITQAGAAMTLTQGSRNAIVNWRSFDVGAGEQFRLRQSGADAAMLARVTGGDPSKILGSLQADGKLFLINAKGVVIGRDATIDTAAFAASTLDLSDVGFLAGGALTFKGDSGAGIVNLGRITAHEGNVMLFAHTVENAGTIAAPKGKAALGAGTEVFVASPDDATFEIKLNLPNTPAATGVENSGAIEAAQAELKAAGGSIYNLAVNQSGIVRANGVERRGGRVILTADGGEVKVSGSVQAQNADGSGGEIFVGGGRGGKEESIANATRTTITASAQLDASATDSSHAAGRVIVWADDTTTFLGSIAARGARDGFAEVSGKRFLDFRPAGAFDLGAGGELLLDPGSIFVGDEDPDDPFVSFMSVDTLSAQLAAADVTLTTGAEFGTVEFGAPLSWSSSHSLLVQATGEIDVNADITAADGTLILKPGRAALIPTEENGIEIHPLAQQSPDSTITIGRLVYGTNPDALPEEWTLRGQTGAAQFDGALKVGVLEVDLSDGGTGVTAVNENNAIGAFRTSGTGDLTAANVANGAGNLAVMLKSENSTAAGLMVTTPGTLTLEDETSLSFAEQADVVLASTGAGFVNEAGANPFGANARFLIYAANSSLTSRGGLVADGDVFDHPFDYDDDFSGDTNNRFLFANESGLPVLTYTADDFNRVYGSANPTFTATVTGLLNDDVLEDVVSGAPAFSTDADQSSGVDTYTINIARGSLVSSTYDFAFVPGTLTIERAPLTITANDASRRLNRENPTFTASYDGLVNGDTASVVSGLRFDTTADLSSAEGVYPITPSHATAANYEITFVPGELTIAGVATLNIAADDFTKTYGDTNPAFTATITGFEDDDDASIVSGLQFSTSASQSSGVGTYVITPFGATASGYVIDYSSGQLTIEPAPLTITAPTLSRSYGDANPDFTPIFSGLVNGDTSDVVNGLSLGTSATPRSNVGAYAVTISGGSAANYAITLSPGTLNVTPATITVKADDLTRLYGDPNPTPTITVTGLKNDDLLEEIVHLFGPTHFATEASGIGAYGINLQGVSISDNYNATIQSGTLTITQRPLTIVADNKTRVYGDPNPEFTATFEGLAPFDTAAVIPDVQFSTQATQTSGVSTFGIRVSSGLNQNYKISYQFGQLQIVPAELVVSGMTDLSRIYGRADPALPTIGVSGLRNGDTEAGLGLGFALPAPTADAGDHTYSVTTTNPNYQLVGNEANFIITPAPLTVQMTPISRLYGDANPANLDLHVTGLAFGQTADEVLRIENPTEATSTVGTYNLFPELLTKNYVVTDIRGNQVQINPRFLTVDVDNFARYYGDATPEFTYQLGGDGLAPFDSASAVIKDVQTAVAINEQTNVGWYRIDPVFTNTPNYRVSWSSGYIAIVPRPIEITVHNGVAFSNNSVPDDFDADALGLDLIILNADGFSGLGYTADVTGLPGFASVQDVLPDLDFNLRSENEPQAIGTAVDLASIQFPARPSRTPPQDTSAPPPGSLPDATIDFTPGQLVVPDQPTPVTFNPIVIEDSGFILGPTLPGVPAGDPTKDRFADVIHYIVPRSYQANNYVVTKVTNGVLTMKADPVIKAETLEREAAAAKAKADRDAFYMNETAAPGEIRVGGTGAFGLPREMMPALRAAIGASLNNEFVNGISDDPGSLANMINGGLQVTSWDQLPEEKIMAWLADIHTNPAKQAIVMPVLMGYTVAVAQKNSASWTEQDKQLMAYVSPALQEARDSFIDAAQQARDNWVAGDGAARGTTLVSLYNGKVPYQKFVEEAVSETMAGAMESFQERAEQFDAAEIGLIGGAGVGTGALTSMTLSLEKVARTLLPRMPAKIHLAMGKAGEEAIERAISKGMSRVGSVLGGGAGTIVSLAVTILVTESMAVADNEKAAANFNALIASRDDAVDPNALMNSEQGSAIMMLGLANLFMGGGSNQHLSTNFDL